SAITAVLPVPTRRTANAIPPRCSGLPTRCGSRFCSTRPLVQRLIPPGSRSSPPSGSPRATEPQQLPQRPPQLVAELLELIHQWRSVPLTIPGRFRARLEPLPLSHRTPLIREIAVDGVNRSLHHSRRGTPGVLRPTLSPAVAIESGPCRSGQASPRGIGCDPPGHIVSEPDRRDQSRGVPDEPDISPVVGGACLARDGIG